MAEQSGWERIKREPPLCDICGKVATWAHPAGGLRCGKCPRPERHPRQQRWVARRGYCLVHQSFCGGKRG